jgi:hypothetical protein
LLDPFLVFFSFSSCCLAVESIIIALYVQGTCISSRRPHALPLWPACIRFERFHRVFGPIMFGTFCRISSVARAVASHHAPSTFKHKGSSGYMTNATLNPPGYSVLRPSWVNFHQLTRFLYVSVSLQFRFHFQLYCPTTTTRAKPSASMARGFRTRPDNTCDTCRQLTWGSGFDSHR